MLPSARLLDRRDAQLASSLSLAATNLSGSSAPARMGSQQQQLGLVNEQQQQQSQRAWGQALCNISATHSLGHLVAEQHREGPGWSRMVDAKAAGQVLDQGIAALDHGLR